jgi:chromosome segregation ATPase
MTELKDMTVQELRKKEQEVNAKISKMSEALQQINNGKAQEEEYSEAHGERTRIKEELEKREAEERRERLNANKRPLPDAPETYLTHEYYFNKKNELEDREREFVQAHEQAVEHLKDVSDKYDTAVLNGSDDEINTLYDEVQKARKQKDVTQSKVKSLQNKTKQRVLEDTAMEVYLSRAHVADMFETERNKLIKEYKAAQDALKDAEDKIKSYNARYENKLNDFRKVLTDLGDNSGLGNTLISKYRERPPMISATKRINIQK